MLPFPLTFNPHHIIFDPHFFTQNHIFSLLPLPQFFLFIFFFFFDLFLCRSSQALVPLLSHGNNKLSMSKEAAGSPWQWWQRRLRFGFGLMGFLLKVWFWVLSCWVFHWRFDFGFRLIFGFIFLCFWLILWLEYHGLWWVVRGCGGGDWGVVGQCWVDLKQTGMNTDKEERERKREINKILYTKLTL